MIFSTPLFLFGFLPIVLLLYYFSPRIFRNSILLLSSWMFYIWGEYQYVVVLILSIAINYLIAVLIAERSKDEFTRKTWLFLGVFINLLVLVIFKYFNFIIENINLVVESLEFQHLNVVTIHLPLGISFFTFQAVSYIVDVYRGQTKAQKNIINLALYISLFPQLIAGPIVRYRDVATQIVARKHSVIRFSEGVKRFVYGLSKKVLVANPLGEVADSVFLLSGDDLSMPLAWIGILSYTLQIYFDFSGYSDMAIGLGRLFGFRFPENFNYPYISTSVTEFWRRWHMSLSTWFRDYVYIPLGGSRLNSARTFINLLVVFLLTGLWHGASWNFLVWGGYYGVLLVVEKTVFAEVLNVASKPVRHVYLLLIVVVGWVFFRADNLEHALSFLVKMTDYSAFETTPLQYAQVLTNEAICSFCVAVFLSTPVYIKLVGYIQQRSIGSLGQRIFFVDLPKIVLISSLLVLSILKVSSSTYDPFIYFRF